MWTLEAAAANHQTLTLEPSRDNYERICETVNRNQFHDRIHLMTIAATSVPATFTLNVPRGNKGGTSVVAVEKVLLVQTPIPMVELPPSKDFPLIPFICHWTVLL